MPLDDAAPKTITRTEAIAELTAPGQPYELEQIVAGGAPIRAFRHAPRSLGQLIADNVSDQPFLVYGDERWSFAEAWADAARIAQVLVRDYGVAKGDRVAISMRNFPEWILAFTAATSIGAIVVALNALWQPEELEYGLADSGASRAPAPRVNRPKRTPSASTASGWPPSVFRSSIL